MSTPTPASSHHPHGSKHPSHAVSYASHAVSTPNAYMVSSTSTPRSVPSPAIPRSAAKPPGAASAQHNAARVKSTTGSAAMAPSLSQTSAGSGGSASGPGTGPGAGLGIGGLGAGTLGMGLSPSANMLNFASPAALAALDMGTPGLLDPSGAIGGQAMNLTLSDLGISSSAGRRNEDEERRIKLEGVLGRLSAGKVGSSTQYRGARRRHYRLGLGRLSEEGVCRAGKWAGFDVEVDTKRRVREFEGQRPVTVAGKNAVLIDFEFKDNVPQNIDISFSSDNDAVTASQADAAKVLLDNLTPIPGKFAHRLDRFAYNLEALAQMDKLSSSRLNCFEAITGLYTSLVRLYEYERKVARSLAGAKPGQHDPKADEEVMCRKSGRPKMHSGSRIGLSLDYWSPEKLVPSSPDPTTQHTSSAAESDMEVDGSNAPSQRSDDAESAFALDIAAEPNDPTLYPSMCVSSEWLSDQVLKPTETTPDTINLLSDGPVIDWLDPPQTYPPPDAMAIDGNLQPASLEARFVARLRPPVVMPWNVAGQILQSVGATSMPSAEHLSTYEAMLLEHGTFQLNTGTGPVVAATKETFVLDAQGKEKHVAHASSLYVPKQEYAYVLDKIPFAHPRQLVQILPILRQWACLGSLLKERFSGAQTQTTGSRILDRNGILSNGIADEPQRPFSLSAILAPSPVLEMPTSTSAVSVDITLATSPSPTLTLVFPLCADRTAHLTVSVLPNADVVITGQKLVQRTKTHDETDDHAMTGVDQGVASVAQDAAKALDLCGDLGLWVEWIRARYGREE